LFDSEALIVIGPIYLNGDRLHPKKTSSHLLLNTLFIIPRFYSASSIFLYLFAFSLLFYPFVIFGITGMIWGHIAYSFLNLTFFYYFTHQRR